MARLPSVKRLSVKRLPGAVLALACAGLAGFAPAVPAAPDSVTSEPFAPGWRDHVRGLINRGPGPDATTLWYVPGNLPRGHYLVLSRRGETATLIEGVSFDVTSDPERELHLVLPIYYLDVESIPAEDVPGVGPPHPRVRFEGP